MQAIYWEKLRRQHGAPAVKVTERRFTEMLEVMYPENWTRTEESESFMVPECMTGDLYLWLARVGQDYWQMIAPRDWTHADVMRYLCFMERWK